MKFPIFLKNNGKNILMEFRLKKIVPQKRVPMSNFLKILFKIPWRAILKKKKAQIERFDLWHKRLELEIKKYT